METARPNSLRHFPFWTKKRNGVFVAVEADANRARCDPNDIAAMGIRSNIGIADHHALPDPEIVIS